MHNVIISSALDTMYNIRVALKKLARPFQSSIHALRTYRELRYLKHMKHENVRIKSVWIHNIDNIEPLIDEIWYGQRQLKNASACDQFLIWYTKKYKCGYAIPLLINVTLIPINTPFLPSIHSKYTCE